MPINSIDNLMIKKACYFLLSFLNYAFINTFLIDRRYMIEMFAPMHKAWAKCITMGHIIYDIATEIIM